MSRMHLLVAFFFFFLITIFVFLQFLLNSSTLSIVYIYKNDSAFSSMRESLTYTYDGKKKNTTCDQCYL